MNQLFSILSKSKFSTLPAINAGGEELKQRDIEEMVLRYGIDSLSYLSLEGNKQYYVDKNIDGFIAYVVIQNVAVCIGNPVCASSNLLEIVSEFKVFCAKRNLKICFSSISEEFSNLLEQDGFVISKYGEEALLDLHSYTIAGGKTEKLRQKLRRAEKLGTRIVEYIPSIRRDWDIEEKVEVLSREWFLHKKGQLTFTLGDLNFDNPLNRRFFVALDEKEDVVAILMFSPFDSQKGYFLDVMRRKVDSVPGVMEKAIIDAAMKIKGEGGRWISLGLAPLAGIDIHNPKATLLEKLFKFVYDHGNSSYGYQSLYHYKKKFNPTCWNTRYAAHEKGLSTIRVAYAMAKARNVESVF
ncbi:MAG: DUF2156 domain-containing protein [Clostridia bacterium]|nr:DUF2156 domain-containing protein [Clostridia bacterium]